MRSFSFAQVRSRDSTHLAPEVRGNKAVPPQTTEHISEFIESGWHPRHQAKFTHLSAVLSRFLEAGQDR